MKSQIILVAPGARCGEAAESGLSVLRFGLGLDSSGTLIRTLAQERRTDDLLCLSDFGVCSPIPDGVIRQLLDEARGSGGLVADFERHNDLLDDFLQRLDAACMQAKLPFFVPYHHANHTPNAYALVPGAASGGCLRDELLYGIQTRNGRFAVCFETTRRRFRLPADNPEGEALPLAQFDALCTQIQPQVFFSQELCANYFTYMDGETGIFVLFDTADTLQKRLRLIKEIGAPYIFADWDTWLTLP